MAAGTTETWSALHDYGRIFDDVVKNKDALARSVPMPVEVTDLQFHKIYETPKGPQWNSWVTAWLGPAGELNITFLVLEGGRANLTPDYGWEYTGPKTLKDAGITRRYVRLQSTDNGRTWNTVQSIEASDHLAPRIMPMLTVGQGDLLGVGGVWASWDDNRREYNDIGKLMTGLSHDNGKTWQSLANVNDPAGGQHLYWCFPKRLRSGTLVLPVYGQVVIDKKARADDALPKTTTDRSTKPPRPESDAALLFSEDGGLSWSKPLLVAKGTSTLTMDEPEVVELGNGDLLVVVRHSNPTRAGTPEVYVNCGQIVVRKVNGTWVAGPLTRTHMPFRGFPALLRTRDGVLICAGSGNQYNFSVDDGKTWGATQIIVDPAHKRHSHYPRLLELSDGRVMSIYHVGNHWPYPPPEPQWIHCTSFKPKRR